METEGEAREHGGEVQLKLYGGTLQSSTFGRIKSQKLGPTSRNWHEIITVSMSMAIHEIVGVVL